MRATMPAAAVNSVETDSGVFVAAHDPERTSTPAVHKPAEYLEDGDNYRMNRACRGKAIIFNNEKFENGSPNDRPGSAEDVKTLVETLKSLGLRHEDITIEENLKHHIIMDKLDEFAAADYTDVDCLIVTVLSHGLTNGWIYAWNSAYEDKQIWNRFTAEKCKTLAEKPKIFFIQACRGLKSDGAVDVQPGVKHVGSLSDKVIQRDASAEQADAVPISYTIPSHADFLIAHSSSRDMSSWREPDEGTWFIQSLCQELKQHAPTADLMDILTRTARRVAFDREVEDAVGERWKQVPSVTSTLTRNLFFFPTEH